MASKREQSAEVKKQQKRQRQGKSVVVPPRMQSQSEEDDNHAQGEKAEGGGEQLIIGASELEALAERIKPAAKSKGKRGKKFADQAYMLSLVDSINKLQEEQIQSRLGHEAELLKRLVRRDQVKKKSRDHTKEQVTRMKDKLRQQGKASAPGGKGDHRKSFGGAASKKKSGGDSAAKKGRKEAAGGGKARRVTFAD